MQARSTQEALTYQPVAITILIESEVEAKALATVCNYTPIVEAAAKAGIDLRQIFNIMPKGSYNSETWSDDVAILAETLQNHPVLQLKALEAPIDDEIIMGGTVTEQLDKMVDDILAPFTEEGKALSDNEEVPKSTRVTCTTTAKNNFHGTIEVSDGRNYIYEIAGCGEAIQIKTTEGTPVTEVPTSKYGTYVLLPEDIEVIEAVLTQIG
jgi:hypothetical protein